MFRTVARFINFFVLLSFFVTFFLHLEPQFVHGQALASQSVHIPMGLGIFTVVKKDVNPSLFYRAILGYDYKLKRYFVKDWVREYPLHQGITSTVFWIGEEASGENGWIANDDSAWDELWLEHYGGVDDPVNRSGYFPAGFVPGENPFYVALPYNDLDENGNRKPDAAQHVYWLKGNNKTTMASVLKDRWVKITKDGHSAYAQWEDVGPFGEDDWPYVFGNSAPANKLNQSAGIDVSPATRDYLNLSDIDKIDWQFVDFEAVEPGPWLFRVNMAGQDWYRPLKASSFYWQLQGNIDDFEKADIYDIDLFDTDQETIDALKKGGKRVICYFSAGSSESWRPDYSRFSQGDLGLKLDGWEGERWLDIRSQNVRKIMTDRLDLAAQKGCDGVEPDNIDGFTNKTGFPLTYEDQLSYNRYLAQEAHRRGLAIGLKNDLEQARDLVKYFDFLLLESCFEYEECSLAGPFIDSLKPVFDVEYDMEGSSMAEKRDNLCQEAARLGIKVMFSNWDLDGSYWEVCN